MKKLTAIELRKRGLTTDPTDDVGAMSGPYQYTKAEIENHVKDVKANGNYRTGDLDENGDFVPRYVGRGVVSDRLKKHLDEGFKDTHFKFLYEKDEVRSYEVESAGYHYFQPQLRNAEHPKKPDGRDDLRCPYCGK